MFLSHCRRAPDLKDPQTLLDIAYLLEGYRCQLDEFSHRTSMNYEHLRKQLQKYMDAA